MFVWGDKSFARACVTGCRLIASVLWLFVPFCAYGMQPSRPTIWFDALAPDHGVRGVLDWDSLFHANPAWDQVAGEIQVYTLSPGYVLFATDNNLKALAENLRTHHIALAMPIQSIAIMPGEACGHEEGYEQPALAARAAEKLHRLGITPQFLTLDGPLWTGHFTSGAQGCHLAIPELVRRIKLVVGEFQRFFPNVRFGEADGPVGILTMPSWREDFEQYYRLFRSVIGRPIEYEFMDVNWPIPSWPSDLKTLAEFYRSQGVKFGVIYGGGYRATDDVHWVSGMIQNIDMFETVEGIVPDNVDFESWTSQPSHVLPQDSDASLSHLLAHYLLPRTKLLVARAGRVIQGQLIDEQGHPVAGAPVRVTELGDDPRQAPPIRVITGTVPQHAQFGMMVLRVNMDCWCSGPNNVMVGPFTYRESGDEDTHVYSFLNDAEKRKGPRPDHVVPEPVSIGGKEFVRFTVPAGQPFGFNSRPFPVTPGATFVVTAPIASLDGQGMFGSAAVIWTGTGSLGRPHVLVPADVTPLGTATTDAQGHFSFAIPAPAGGPGIRLRVMFNGTATLRGAGADLP